MNIAIKQVPTTEIADAVYGDYATSSRTNRSTQELCVATSLHCCPIDNSKAKPIEDPYTTLRGFTN